MQSERRAKVENVEYIFCAANWSGFFLQCVSGLAQCASTPALAPRRRRSLTWVRSFYLWTGAGNIENGNIIMDAGASLPRVINALNPYIRFPAFYFRPGCRKM